MRWYPPVAEGLLSYRDIYEQRLRTLPAATRVTAVVHPDEADGLERLLVDTRPQADSQVVTTPDYPAFTVWAEDACVVTEDYLDGWLETVTGGQGAVHCIKKYLAR